MEGNLQEAKTIPSISYVDRFFSELPNDARFGSVSWVKKSPMNGADRKLTTFDFLLPPMGEPNVYLVKIYYIHYFIFLNHIIYIIVFVTIILYTLLYVLNHYPQSS